MRDSANDQPSVMVWRAQPNLPQHVELRRAYFRQPDFRYRIVETHLRFPGGGQSWVQNPVQLAPAAPNIPTGMVSSRTSNQ